MKTHWPSGFQAGPRTPTLQFYHLVEFQRKVPTTSARFAVARQWWRHAVRSWPPIGTCPFARSRLSCAAWPRRSQTAFQQRTWSCGGIRMHGCWSPHGHQSSAPGPGLHSCRHHRRPFLSLSPSSFLPSDRLQAPGWGRSNRHQTSLGGW